MAQLRPTAGLRPMSTLYAARPPADSSASSCSSSVSGDTGDYTDARPPGIFYWSNGDSIILLRTLLDVLGTSDGTAEPLVSVVYRMLPARIRESRSATSVRLRINLLQQWCHTHEAMRGLLAWLEELNPAGVANLGDWPVDEDAAPLSSSSGDPMGLLYTDEYTVGGRDDVVSVHTSGMTGPRYMSPSHALVPNGGIISIRSSNSSNSSGSGGRDHAVMHPRRGLFWNNAESILLLRVLLHVRDTHDVSGVTFVQLVNLVHAALPAPVRDARLNIAVRMRLEMLQQWCLPYGGARAWCQTDEGIRELIAWLETMDPDDVADHRDWRLASDNTTTRSSSNGVTAASAADDTEWVTPLAMRRLPRAATLARPRYTDGDGGGDGDDDNVGGIVDANADPDANFPWCNGDTLILARIMRHARVRDASMVSYRALTRLLPDCIVRHRRPMSIRVRIQLILTHAPTGVLDRFIQDLEQQDADGLCHLDDGSGGLPHPMPAHPVGHPPQPVRPRMLPIAGVARKKKVWCNAHMLAVVRVLLALQWTVRAPVPHDRVYALLPASLKDEWRQSQILERTRRFVYMLRDEAHFARVQLALEKSSAMRAFDSALVNRLIHGYFNKGAIAQSVVQKRKVVIARPQPRPQPQPRSQPPAPSILTPRVRRVVRESEEDQADDWEYQEQETIRALVSLAHHAAIAAEDRPAVVGGEPPFRRRASPIRIPPSPPVRPRFKRGRLYPAPIVISDSSSDDEDYRWHRPAPVMPFQDPDAQTPEPPAVPDSATMHKITLQVADE